MNTPSDPAAAGLRWLDQDVLRHSRGRVVKRAELEQLLNAERQRLDLLAQAQDAQARLSGWRQAAERSGHTAGHAAGLAAGRDDWARQLAERQWQRHRQLDDLRPTLVTVVMQALRHLVQALPDAQRFELLAGQLIDSAVQARRLRLVVAPGDAPAAEALLLRWQARAGAGGVTAPATEVLADENLAPGDCVLETDEAAVDGRLSQRLAALEAALQAQLSDAAPQVLP